MLGVHWAAVLLNGNIFSYEYMKNHICELRSEELNDDFFQAFFSYLQKLRI